MGLECSALCDGVRKDGGSKNTAGKRRNGCEQKGRMDVARGQSNSFSEVGGKKSACCLAHPV